MSAPKIILIVILFVLTQCCFGQLNDNFSDGEFTNNPTWVGDNSKYTVNAGKLKLQAPAVAETAFLSTTSLAIHNASWEFYLQMDFSPSSTNFARVYLVSDRQNLSGPLNGYFIKVGNTSREISLYRQSGMVETKIVDGLDDRINVSVVKLRIRVTRNDVGAWLLYSDAGLTGTYSLEGSFIDNTYTLSSYFGVQCVYTSTRSDKFWFDDFVVSGVPVPDQTPPSIQSAVAVTQRQVRLVFSEELEPSSSQAATNFSLQNLGSPTSASLQVDHKTILADFFGELTNGVSYPLEISGVKDLAGNEMVKVVVNVLFFKAVVGKKKDIIFTEIFPDPSPQIGLPNAEFVEIYNRSSYPFDLMGWKLSDGSSTGIFSSQIILPGDYWIVTGNSSINLFIPYGKTMGLINFPTLNNSGDAITLTDPNQVKMDSIHYTIDEYRDSDKQEGGWTLELIDPNNPCGEQDNWTAAEDPTGGTPGRENSVIANKPDFTSPELLSVFPELTTRITLSFNEKLGQESLTTENFSIHEQAEVRRVFFKDQSLRTIEIDLGETLITQHEYALGVKNIVDCNGNIMQSLSFKFGLPENPDSLDVVVNEILFNPRAGGADFVEVYNRSRKYLNLKNWKVSNDEKGTLINVTTLFSENVLLPPGGFKVFSSDPVAVWTQYPNSVQQNIVKTPLPGLSDDSGSIVVLSDHGEVLDALLYSKDWHSEFIKNEEGVSLERISERAPTNSRNNWASASSLTGFATPGYGNSQSRNPREPSDSDVIIVPEIFSPASGANDFVEIKYRIDQGTWVANVRILDHQGHHLKTIANNETLGSEGFFRWDGDRDDGNKARMGYYVVWFEIFNASGILKTFRRRVIVSTR